MCSSFFFYLCDLIFLYLVLCRFIFKFCYVFCKVLQEVAEDDWDVEPLMEFACSSLSGCLIRVLSFGINVSNPKAGLVVGARKWHLCYLPGMCMVFWYRWFVCLGLRARGYKLYVALDLGHCGLCLSLRMVLFFLTRVFPIGFYLARFWRGQI